MWIVIFKPNDLRFFLEIYNKGSRHIHFAQLSVVIVHILPDLNTDKAVLLRIVWEVDISAFFVGEYIKFKMVVSLLTSRNS